MAKTKAKNTLVTFLLDRTGSMGSIIDATMEAFNAYADGLRKDKNIRFSLIQFDSVSLDKTCVGVSGKDIPLLTKKNYQPRASTPLIDASYKTIKAVEKSLEGESKTQVVICIQTDGYENASREHTWEQLNDLIKEKMKAGWQFNFMGAGIDAYQQASKMGIGVAATMSYDAKDLAATRSAFMANANNTSSFAAGLRTSTDYSSNQKMSAGDKFDPAHNRIWPSVAVVGSNAPKFSLRGDNPKQVIVDDFSLTDEKK